MSVLLKSVVERIITDPAFRKAFIAKPEEFLDEEGVSPSERRALIRVSQRLSLAGTGWETTTNPWDWP